MPEPSLSEITNLTVDPERGTGTPAVVFDNREFIRNLNQAANQEAQYKWAKYNKFLELKKDAFKDLQEIQKLPVANQDKELLRKKAQDLYGFIANNPDAFSGKNQAAFDEINGQLSDLLGNATQSKMDRAEDDWNRRYIDANPELNNDVNLEKQQGFWKKPLNERTPYVLDMPVLFDYDNFHNDLIKGATTVTEDSKVVGPDGNDGEGYIQNLRTTTINRDNFIRNRDNALLYKTDKNGQPYRKYAQGLFNKLPDKQKNKFIEQGGDPVANFWHWQSEMEFSHPKNIEYITKDKLTADPNFLKKDELGLDIRKQGEVERHNRAMENLDRAQFYFNVNKFNSGEKEDATNAMSVINEAKDIINKGTPIQFGGSEMIEIGDPSVLKLFGDIDKDGKTTNVADAIRYDGNKNQALLIYYDDKKLKKGEKVIIKETPLDQRTWLNIIAKRNNPNKDIGKVTGYLDTYLTKNGDNLFKIAKQGDSYDNKTEEVDLKSLDRNGFKQEGDNFRYKDGRLFDASGKIIK